MNPEITSSTGEVEQLRIPLEDILSATNNFDQRNFIAMGGFGRVYQGHSPKYGTLAVKRLSIGISTQGQKEFMMEIKLLSAYKHENLASLVGFCDQDGEKILVYKHESKGSLDKLLKSTDLDWIQRLWICLGAARGLKYLHDDVGSRHRVVHRDIKSANILLDEELKAKISDFGLSKINPVNGSSSILISNACGTLGYIDPDYVMYGVLTEKSDIYSFGVVLFEVLCGRPSQIVAYKDKRQFLCILAKNHYQKGRIDELIDRELRKQMNSTSLRVFSTIAYECLRSREDRPTMIQVVEQLEKALDHQLLASCGMTCHSRTSSRGEEVYEETFDRSRKKATNSHEKRGDTMLHLASRAGNLIEVIQIIQRLDVDDTNAINHHLLSKQNEEGETPLYVAAENGHSHVVVEFMKHIDLQTASIVSNNGYDSFHVAARKGHLEVLRELLSSFSDLVMTTNLSNSTALHTAATHGHIDVVNLLLDADSNLINIVKNNGNTVLHTAAKMGHLEVVKSVLRKDPTIACRTDKKCQTALHMAAKGHNTDIMVELIKSDPISLNREDNNGNTPLHIATKKGNTKMVKCLLLSKGIDVNAVNKAGDAPLDIAEDLKISKIVNSIEKAGATHSKDSGSEKLKQTVREITQEVHSQLNRTRETNLKVRKMAKKLKKLQMDDGKNGRNNKKCQCLGITCFYKGIVSKPNRKRRGKTP